MPENNIRKIVIEVSEDGEIEDIGFEFHLSSELFSLGEFKKDSFTREILESLTNLIKTGLRLYRAVDKEYDSSKH